MAQENSKISSFRDLKIWQNGLIIAQGGYYLTKKLLKEETFDLVSPSP
jgi:hypothetical protein